MMTPSFTLKGRHVLAALLGFFAVVMGANAVFLSFAIRSFPGQEVEKSYLQGLRFNEELDARARQASLGWSASLTDARRTDAGAVIEIVFRGRDGKALSGLAIKGELRRPASNEDDRALAFAAAGEGTYRAQQAGLAPGAYDLSLWATSAEGETFKLEKRLFLP